MQQVLDLLEQVREISKDFAGEAGQTRARLDALDKSVTRLLQIVTDGNGHSLVTRVSLLEEHSHHRSSGSHSTGDKTSELARVEIKRAEAKKALADVMKAWAPIATAVAAAIMALLAYLKGVK